MIDTLVCELDAARALDVPKRFGLRPREFALVTLHRPSNVDEAHELRGIVDVLMELSAQITVVFPIHPRTRARLHEYGFFDDLVASGVRHFEPLGYREMIGLMEKARVVLTDSGGVQEETTYFGVPCLTLRPNTERPITVTAGTNTVVGSDFGLAKRVIGDITSGTYTPGGSISGWDGQAATRVADALTEAWQ